MTKYQRIRSGFNFLAPVYDVVATVLSFNSIHRSQIWALTKPVPYNKVLILGGGTGKFLLELMKRNTASHYCYVDISDKMIESARKKVEKNYPSKELVQFICGSYTDIPPDEKFDLIVTNYSLDCFTDEELPAVVNCLHKYHTPGGYWFFTDFNMPAKPVSKLFAAGITGLLYAVFNMVCGLDVKKLPGFKAAFSKAGYTKLDEKYFFGGLLVARIYRNNGHA